MCFLQPAFIFHRILPVANLFGADVLTTRGWDDYGRLTSLTNLLGTEELHYDGKSGRVTWTKLGSLKTSYGDDTTSGPGEHRLGAIGHTWNDAANNYTDHAYGYDGSGRLTSWGKSADGATKLWTMGYDASEQLETVSETIGTALANVHHYTYDAEGNRTSEQRNGGVRSWAANPFNQLTNQTVGGELELRGTVSPKSTVKIDGQAAQMREGGVPAASGTEWRKKTNAAAGQNTFAMKATEDAPPGFVPRVLNKTIEVNLQPVPQITFAYDADGNLTTDGMNSYVWDAENRLVSVWNSTIGLVEFGYDAFSRRVSLSEKPDGITANKNLRLMWEGLTLVGQVDTASSVNNHTRLFFGNGERRISTIGAAVNLYYTRDHLGSIRELVDASNGGIRARYDYTPYGMRTKVQSSGDLDSDFGFTGHYTNLRSGLVLAPFRAYSPELGRWISRDPIEEEGGINLYGYVHNGPLGAVDPLGLDTHISNPPDFRNAVSNALDTLRAIGAIAYFFEGNSDLLSAMSYLDNCKGVVGFKKGNPEFDAGNDTSFYPENSGHNGNSAESATISIILGGKLPDGSGRPLEVALAHEIGHAIEGLLGKCPNDAGHGVNDLARRLDDLVRRFTNTPARDWNKVP